MNHAFLHNALIYLAAAIVFVPIAKKMGMGSVLGYLLAGIIIGPFFLSFIGEEGKDIMHFAEFDVVMMLFLIELELEPTHFWGMRNLILGTGSLQVCATTVLFLPVFLIIGFSWQARFQRFGLSMSSTAIVMQTLRRKDNPDRIGKVLSPCCFFKTSPYPFWLFAAFSTIRRSHSCCSTYHALCGITRMGANDHVIGRGWADDPERSPRDCPLPAVYWPHPFARTFYGSGAINRDWRCGSNGVDWTESGAGSIPGWSRSGQQRIPSRIGERH
jgi:hypothetical protein